MKDILLGKFEVPLLETTADAIGKMDTVCEYCGALKYAQDGKIRERVLQHHKYRT